MSSCYGDTVDGADAGGPVTHDTTGRGCCVVVCGVWGMGGCGCGGGLLGVYNNQLSWTLTPILVFMRDLGSSPVAASIKKPRMRSYQTACSVLLGARDIIHVLA